MSDELISLLSGAGLTGLAAQLRTITPEDAMRDYEKLRSTSCKTIQQSALTGNKAMDYIFFPHRLRTKAARGISFPEWLKTDEHQKPYYQKFIKKSMEAGNSLIKAKYAAFRMYSGSGAISAFKPIIARSLYCKFKPTTILDFSAGWGGRCLAAMSLDINYIGFDTNKTLQKAYKDMVKMYPSESKVSINFRDSSKVDYSKYDYDMVFTSPPYFKKTTPTERYEQMPEYKDRDDFNERFLFPVVRNTFENLKAGGTYALNIPIDMYDDIKEVLGAAKQKIPLTLASRGKKEVRLGGGYKEFIYVWKKSGGVRGGGKSDVLPKPKWKHESLVVKKSTIPNAGNGVFATEDIPKGVKLQDYLGTPMKIAAFNKKYAPEDRKYYYSAGLFERIDGRSHKRDNISHYVNYSDKPNVIFKKKALYTNEKIKAGEELFLKYPKGHSFKIDN